jgi:hypothetical protein
MCRSAQAAGAHLEHAERHIYVPPQLQAQMRQMQGMGRMPPMPRNPHPLP